MLFIIYHNNSVCSQCHNNSLSVTGHQLSRCVNNRGRLLRWFGQTRKRSELQLIDYQYIDQGKKRRAFRLSRRRIQYGCPMLRRSYN